MSHPSEDTASPTAVVIVSHQCGPFLARAVRSVLASTVAVEVLVVDNASTDRSLAGLQEAVGGDPRVRILRNDSNRGFAAAVNQGLAVSRGPFVLLLNPDAVVESDTIAGMLEAMREHPDAGLAGGLILNPDGTEQSGARRSFPSLGRSFVHAFGLWRLGERGRSHDFVHAGDPLPPGPVDVDAISGAFMLVRRPALEQVGPMDEGYTLHCEDLDWCARFRQAGWRVLFVPQVRVIHEKGVSSRARPLFAHWHKHRGMIRFYRKFLARHYPAPLRLLVVAGVALRFLVLAPAVIAGALRRRWSRPREAGPA
jgi:hypothetical protein